MKAMAFFMKVVQKQHSLGAPELGFTLEWWNEKEMKLSIQNEEHQWVSCRLIRYCTHSGSGTAWTDEDNYSAELSVIRGQSLIPFLCFLVLHCEDDGTLHGTTRNPGQCRRSGSVPPVLVPSLQTPL